MRQEYSATDPPCCLRFLTEDTTNRFRTGWWPLRRYLDRPEEALASELRETRNLCAHNAASDADDPPRHRHDATARHRDQGQEGRQRTRRPAQRCTHHPGTQGRAGTEPPHRTAGDTTASLVINLQTNFGGGKTHSMLAVWHLFAGLDRSRDTGFEDLRACHSKIRDTLLEDLRAPHATRKPQCFHFTARVTSSSSCSGDTGFRSVASRLTLTFFGRTGTEEWV